jgi:hypothetical protein
VVDDAAAGDLEAPAHVKRVAAPVIEDSEHFSSPLKTGQREEVRRPFRRRPSGACDRRDRERKDYS